MKLGREVAVLEEKLAKAQSGEKSFNLEETLANFAHVAKEKANVVRWR